jgi:DNA-binding transcriptional ArsR family regulator
MDALDALGDGTRRKVFERLRRGPLSVGDIAKDLPISRPAVSQHLKILREAKLVAVSTEGTRRVYRVEPDGLAQLRTYLEEFWDSALQGFKEVAELEGGKR